MADIPDECKAPWALAITGLNQRRSVQKTSEDPRFVPAYHDLEEGDVVLHRLYGVGVVTSVAGRTLDVNFGFPYLRKRIINGKAPIVKVGL